ncbi:MAG: D-alanyl-D-alanine carboxypeptidase family protein [Candidatus Gracilibacteria bacterium]|jgi:D-alanyl-D-alanine carboxypeptidase|nr:D-alanyl-D-alanine carboxypeptidase family protein [Candidatus Gracilibacteria bacterium]
MIELILSIIISLNTSGEANFLNQTENILHFTNTSEKFTKDETMISPIISAKSAVVLDLESGAVLFEQNSNEKMPIASLTKLMTNYIVLKENDLNEIVTVSSKAANEQGSRMGIYSGEKISLKNLVLGSLINSGNDASIALAEHNAGSVSKFVEKMNLTANDLSLYNTKFQNPTGIDQTDHYSSAMDIANLARKVYENDFLKEAVKTKEIIVENETGKIRHRLISTNDLLDSYLTVLGLKTGTTPMAGECLSTITELPNKKLILTVVLASKNRFKDSKILIDWINRAYFAKNSQELQY